MGILVSAHFTNGDAQRFGLWPAPQWRSVREKPNWFTCFAFRPCPPASCHPIPPGTLASQMFLHTFLPPESPCPPCRLPGTQPARACPCVLWYVCRVENGDKLETALCAKTRSFSLGEGLHLVSASSRVLQNCFTSTGLGAAGWKF